MVIDFSGQAWAMAGPFKVRHTTTIGAVVSNARVKVVGSMRLSPVFFAIGRSSQRRYCV
jgi:hypothetical protein